MPFEVLQQPLFFTLYLSNSVVRQFNEIYDLKHPFFVNVFFNYQSITYFFILILNINKNDKVAINQILFIWLSDVKARL